MYIFRIGSNGIVQFLIYKNSKEFFISKRRKEKLRKKGRRRENVSLYILMDRRRFVSKQNLETMKTELGYAEVDYTYRLF